jgi:caspase domain-containing protein
MEKLLSWVAAVATITFAVIGGCVDAWAERRVALVVGNAAYKVANISLANPRNDAEDISAVLKTLGFEVVTTVDATKREMDLALQRFARLATDADSALFFYAGHAMQFQGRNFLMPTDAELEDEISVRYQTVGLEEVRAALDRANGVKIMILDACRNNPLADRLQRTIVGASRSVAATRGLARIDKTQGMVVAYATAADEVAQDGQGRNSPFTAALLKRLQEPGLEIEMMFRRVAYDVNVQTGGRQRPETTISLLSEYYLNQSDRIVWDRIKDQDDVAALRDFVNKYPSSPHAIFARNRLDLLERYAREREEVARSAREEERRRLAEAEAQRIAREAALRREAEERLRAEQLAAQKRAEEEQKRQEALRQQQEEQKHLAALQQQQEEQKRQEAARLEAARQEALRQEALRRQQDEQKRQEALRQQQEEQKRLAALQQQQEEQKRQEALRQQADLERRRSEENCRREEAKLAELRAHGASAREELVKFETAADCKALRPLIAAAVTALPPDVPPVNVPVTPVPMPSPMPRLQPAKANLPEQIRHAQTELKRLGCFNGNPDSRMNEATRNAVKAFWSHTHKPVVEINITDEFIADLEQHRDRICGPPPAKREPLPVANQQRPPRGEPAPPREALRAGPAAPVSAAPAPAAPAARATAGTSGPTIGTGF